MSQSLLQTESYMAACPQCGFLNSPASAACLRCRSALPCTVDPVSRHEGQPAEKKPESNLLRTLDIIFTVMMGMGMYYYYFDRYGARTLLQKQFRLSLLLIGSVGVLITGTLRLLRKHTSLFVFAFLLLSGALSVNSQAQVQRSARSLTSEDLLNRPVVYLPQRVSTSGIPSSDALRSAGSPTSYRDPAGAFTLSFPNGNWRVNAKVGSAGARLYNQRSFRRIEAEGFASATANVYVLTGGDNLAIVDPSRLSADGLREFAATLAARFLSSNASVVAVEPFSSSQRAGLRIIADQTIARRVMVRASINAFEREGRLFVVVCCASPETFDAHAREFEAITNSLASSVMRS